MRSLVPVKSNGAHNQLVSQRMPAWTPDRIIDRLWHDLWGPAEAAPFMDGAAMDLHELDDEVRVSVEVPGIAPDELEVSLAGQVLTLSAEKRDEHQEHAKYRTYSERRFGSFHRAIRLPCAVDPEKVHAAHENGVVTITLTKSDAVRPKRIKVSAA